MGIEPITETLQVFFAKPWYMCPQIIRLSELSTIAVSVTYHSCQFPISRDLTVGFLVLRMGIEPMPPDRKSDVFTPSLT